VRLPVKNRKVWAVTPLFVALMVVETTDVMFAVDSIPAIFAITTDPFIVFTSNIFAILGLRSLYFVLASLLDKFRYLKYSLIFILFFVGVKILVSHWVHLSAVVSLVVIALSLAAGIVFSLVKASQTSETLR
jgi:tellurite resistance protein TerC